MSAKLGTMGASINATEADMRTDYHMFISWDNATLLKDGEYGYAIELDLPDYVTEACVEDERGESDLTAWNDWRAMVCGL